MLELIEAMGFGLVLLLPLSNPLTAVALFLELSEDMSFQQRNKQAFQSAIYVFAIMMITWFAGTAVLNMFGISIPSLCIAGGLIVAFIGFRMLFPVRKLHDSPEVKHKQDELQNSADDDTPVCAYRHAWYRRPRHHRGDYQYRLDRRRPFDLCTMGADRGPYYYVFPRRTVALHLSA